MHIDAYQFGRIVIDGKEYTQDVIIHPDRVQASWWRRQGHFLHMEDLQPLLENPPAVLIIGNGYSGVMCVPGELVAKLEAKGIAVHVSNTRESVALYNRLAATEPSLAAALHLTC